VPTHNAGNCSAELQGKKSLPPWLTCIIWLAISILLAAALARVAVWLQLAGFSTVVLFPLIVGAVLGAVVGFAGSQVGEVSRRIVVVGAILAGAICAAAEHGYFYLDYRRGFESKLQSDPKAQLAATMNPEKFEPASFSKYMAAQTEDNWPLWIADAIAMIGAAGVAAWFMCSNTHANPRGNTSAADNN
jgi:hypothetical protein